MFRELQSRISKMLEKTASALMVFVSLHSFVISQSVHSRAKRFLIVPPQVSQIKLIVAFGTPLQLEDEAITMGYLMKAFYLLPKNANQLKWNYFPDAFGNFTPTTYSENHWMPFPDGRRKRDIFASKFSAQNKGSEKLEESSEGDHFDESFDDEFLFDGKQPSPDNFPRAKDEELMDSSGSRWLMYDGLGRLLTSQGYEGRPCVLRGICEAAEVKFTHHSGLAGELLHIIFT